MKIFAIGKNYILHNEEMDGRRYRPEQPVVFMKPESALLKNSKPFFLPDHLGRVDYECEVVVRICRLGKNVAEKFAHRYYDAITVGIDFTARDLQRRLKDAGHPWEISKAFDGSAAIGEWVALKSGNEEADDGQKDADTLAICADNDTCRGSLSTRIINPSDVTFSLTVNGEQRQVGNTADMLYSIDELISYISRFFTLKTGDMLFTGTPVGIGPVSIGDHLEGYLESQKLLDFYIR